MKGVVHTAADASLLASGAHSIPHLINMVMESAAHPGSAQTRAGRVSVGILDLSVPITFATPMPSDQYEVFIQPLIATAVALWPTSYTAEGFTLNIAVGLTGDISWIAVETGG